MLRVNELLEATKGRLISGKINAAVKGISTDSRSINPGDVFIAIKGDNFDGHDFIGEVIRKGAACIIAKAGVKLQQAGGAKKIALIEVRDTVKALGDIARFQRRKFNIPVIAVTGSNGKTTTKEMIAWVLSARYRVLKNIGTKNNHIGLPQTLCSLDGSYDIAVLEVGTNHSGEVKYLADICLANIGVICNIGQSHLEFFKNLAGVFREKYSLVKSLQGPAIAVLNNDDPLLRKKIEKKSTKPVVLGFGARDKSDFYATRVKALDRGITFLVNNKYRFTLKTLGRYNIYNALAAISIARLFGMGYKEIAGRISSFAFPAGRLNFTSFKNINFIDDTYNSNPLSLEQALETLKNFKARGRRIFIMGDMLELGSRQRLFHRKAGKSAAGACDFFIAVGRLSKAAAEAAERCGMDARNIFTCNSNLEARDILFKRISPGRDDIVLVKGSRSMKMEEVFKS